MRKQGYEMGEKRVGTGGGGTPLYRYVWPKGMVLEPFWFENRCRFYPFWSESLKWVWILKTRSENEYEF